MQTPVVTIIVAQKAYRILVIFILHKRHLVRNGRKSIAHPITLPQSLSTSWTSAAGFGSSGALGASSRNAQTSLQHTPCHKTPHCAVLWKIDWRLNGACQSHSTKAAQLKRLGANIRRQRTNRGITQERLAEAADLNTRTIQKIEAGTTNILVTTLRRIRKALRCSCEDLLGKS